MTRRTWFMIFLWTWLASLPLLIVAGLVADKAQTVLHPFPASPTIASIQAYYDLPTPAAVIALRMANALLIFYFMLGWVPTLILGIAHQRKLRRQV